MEPGPHPQSTSRIPARSSGARNAPAAPVRRASTARLHSSSVWYGRSLPGRGSGMQPFCCPNVRRTRSSHMRRTRHPPQLAVNDYTVPLRRVPRIRSYGKSSPRTGCGFGEAESGRPAEAPASTRASCRGNRPARDHRWLALCAADVCRIRSDGPPTLTPCWRQDPGVSFAFDAELWAMARAIPARLPALSLSACSGFADSGV